MGRGVDEEGLLRPNSQSLTGGDSRLWHRVLVPAPASYVAWRAGATTLCQRRIYSLPSGAKNLATGVFPVEIWGRGKITDTARHNLEDQGLSEDTMFSVRIKISGEYILHCGLTLKAMFPSISRNCTGMCFAKTVLDGFGEKPS